MYNYLYEKRNRKNKGGFTLMELIIVIAILAILAAILVPSMIGYMDRAKDSVGSANARTVYSAATAAFGFWLTDGNTGAPNNVTYKEVTSLVTTQGSFEAGLKKLLGDGFKGYVSVTFDSTGTAVESVKWGEDSTEANAFEYTTVINMP